MRFLLSIILFACIFLCSCSATNPMPTETFYDSAISFDLTDAKSMINTLVSYKRNSEDGRNSVLNDVSDILDKYGYEAEIQEYTHNGAMLYHDMPYVIMGEKNLETPVSSEFFTVYDSNDAASSRTDKNIIFKKNSAIENSDTLIICAHYDSLEGQGANDNASGVTALIETAKCIRNMRLNINICFCLFSGEELGLTGSRYFCGRLNSIDKEYIIGAINVDCVGGKNSGSFLIYTCDGLSNKLTDDLGLGSENILKCSQSDHLSFYAAGIPSIMLCQDINLIDKKNDTIENIDFSVIESAVNYLIEYISLYEC